MTIVNIRRDVEDKFYRYRMPLLETKIEGRGNGIKTVVPNMSEISRALSRPPACTYTSVLTADPTKFFGCELGAQTVIDEKNDRYIVNGAHDANRLRELLDGFIDKFVLCGECKNPETDLKIRNGDILRDCKACGKRTYVDMRHKLTTYISKNPPPKRVKGAKGAGAASGQTVSTGDDDENGGSDDELTRRIHSEAAHIPTAEQRGADKDDDWSVDTSEAAVAQRVKALEGTLNNVLGLDDDEDDDESSPYSQLCSWILEERQDGKLPSAADVYRKVQELGIEKKHKTLQALFQALFDESAPQQVEQYGPLLIKLVTSEKHQKAMLGGIERLAGVQYPALVPNGVPKILMALYQIDVLDEEVVRQWGTHVSKKYVDKDTSKRVRKAASPFIEWLDQADDESDETENTDAGPEAGDSDLDDL